MTALPTRKLEAWRYTDLRPLTGITFATPPALSAPDLPSLDLPRLVFLNGAAAPEFSADLPFAGAFVPPDAEDVLPLAQINAAAARDGATLSVPAGQDAGALLLFAQAGGETAFAMHPRHRIVLGEGAHLTLIEIAKGNGEYWHNPVFDIALAKGARLEHVRVQQESEAAFSLCTIRAEIGEGAAYEHFTAAIGARISRTEIHATLVGEAARADVNAVELLRGTQHADVTTIIRHQAAGCPSRQVVKAVLADDARGVFQGRVEVAPGAQKTDAYQMTRALLLSPRAEMDIKPELEIFADDVKCSHGATIGALDDEQLFYLRSRGIDELTARAMLVRAFLDDALAPVEQPQARGLLDEAIESWWRRS